MYKNKWRVYDFSSEAQTLKYVGITADEIDTAYETRLSRYKTPSKCLPWAMPPKTQGVAPCYCITDFRAYV